VRNQRISRREWVLGASGLPLLKGAKLQNISFPLQTVQGTITPAEYFFVRDHFVEPELSLSSWTLSIQGKVGHPIDMTFSDILEAPTKKVEAVLECAGNPASGAAVSNAVWEGVSLSQLLEQAKPMPDATFVLLEGADSGRLLNQNSPNLPYVQIVPLKECMEPETIIAVKVNGRFLTRQNGFPARALLPGWYGMDSVKWLRRIMLLGPADKPAEFYESGMDRLYNRTLKTADGEREMSRLTEVRVKSEIAYPAESARLPAVKQSVWGFAWAGKSLIRNVELSTDGGNAWEPAKFESASKPFTWVRWNYIWQASPGEHILVSRAYDSRGKKQPLRREPARQDGYELNNCAEVHCSVR